MTADIGALSGAQESGEPANGDWIDVSVPVREGMLVWPNTPEFRIETVFDVERGDPFTASSLSMSTHPGTHVDAPLHFIAGGASVERLSLGAMIGRARVVQIADPARVTAGELEQIAPKRGERLLLRTRNSEVDWAERPFTTDYVHVTEDAAKFLVACGVRTVGIDHLSVGPYEGNGRGTHLALLEAGICIIEGLRLADVPPGDYELICLPLRLHGADAGPARVVLRPA